MNGMLTKARRNSSGLRCSFRLLLLFLTGAVLGCGLVWLLGLGGRLLPQGDGTSLVGDLPGFRRLALLHAKFLLVLFLLGFCRWGALLIPPLFGLEGLLISALFGACLTVHGAAALGCLALLVLPRLLLVLPYGFLLGTWAISQSLRFGEAADRNAAGVLALTLLVIALSALLECSLCRWLGVMYFLKFGV